MFTTVNNKTVYFDFVDKIVKKTLITHLSLSTTQITIVNN